MITWHCCGPWRVGDAVFGLCFFGVIWLATFCCGVIVVAPDAVVVVIVVRGCCWLAVEVFAVVITTFEIVLDDDCDSITFVTENEIKKFNIKFCQPKENYFRWKGKLKVSGGYIFSLFNRFLFILEWWKHLDIF